jgi:hypothetical protein
MGLIVGLLVLWVILIILGFAVKTLFWLVIIGAVLFVITAVFGVVRNRH